MLTWPEVRVWRRAKRAELLAQRQAMSGGERQRAGAKLRDLVGAQFSQLRQACIGFYWPFTGEPDMLPLVADLVAQGATAALPVVVEKNQPVEFWAWRPGMKLDSGVWDIPIPAARAPVRPTALLVPLLGFDGAGYRLGYGGGYYDRTLAAMEPKPLTVGIGYELGRLQTIYPQPHDIPLDAIVTEAAHETAPAYASPACLMHEVEPGYLGYLDTAETVALLNRLLEGERAGARGLAEISRDGAPGRAVLSDIADDEGLSCAILARHIARLDGTPSPRTGTFYTRLMALETFGERIAFLNRGQAAVVRTLQEALPRIADAALRNDLKTMLDIHEQNIQRCTALLTLAAG
jgi:5-formyltetrahydrofolate cyclo-ligase